MKNKKVIVGISSLVLVGAMLISSKEVLAYQGDYTKIGPNCTPERHELMVKALESGNYSAWAELMQGKGRVTQVINESNFSKFAEAYKLGKSGNYEEADAIRKDLGLRTRDGEGVGAGYRQGNGQGKVNRQTINN
jgi:hypothetical protein